MEATQEVMGKIDGFEGPDIANVLQSCSRLQYSPGDNFMRAMVDAGGDFIPEMHPNDVIRMVVAARSL